MFHHVQYSSMGCKGGDLALMGQGHQPPQGPCAWERGNPKGEGLHLTWEALLPPLAAPQAPSRAGRTPWGGNPRWAQPLPLPYI